METIGRLWVAGLGVPLAIGAYEIGTEGQGAVRLLALVLGLGALACFSYLIPKRVSSCEKCGGDLSGGHFCPQCGAAQVDRAQAS